MFCVSIGRGIAAQGFYSDITSMPMFAFAIDTIITLIGAIILYRHLRSSK